MPTLDSTAKAAAAAQAIAPVFYVFLDVVGDPVRTTTGPGATFAATGDSDLDGTYSAVDPRFLTVGDVVQQESGSDTLTVSLSGIASIDTALLNEIGDVTKWRGRVARLWMQVRDASGAVQGAIVPFYTGYMAAVSILPRPRARRSSCRSRITSPPSTRRRTAPTRARRITTPPTPAARRRSPPPTARAGPGCARCVPPPPAAGPHAGRARLSPRLLDNVLMRALVRKPGWEGRPRRLSRLGARSAARLPHAQLPALRRRRREGTDRRRPRPRPPRQVPERGGERPLPAQPRLPLGRGADRQPAARKCRRPSPIAATSSWSTGSPPSAWATMR
jgi:hypothetical protein